MPHNIICLLVNVFHSTHKKDKKTSFNSPTLGSSAVLYEKLLLGKNDNKKHHCIPVILFGCML